jgi:hypothetical protein
MKVVGGIFGIVPGLEDDEIVEHCSVQVHSPKCMTGGEIQREAMTEAVVNVILDASCEDSGDSASSVLAG